MGRWSDLNKKSSPTIVMMDNYNFNESILESSIDTSYALKDSVSEFIIFNERAER